MAKALALAIYGATESEFEAYLRTRSFELRDAIVLKHAQLVKRLAAHHARNINLREDLEQVGYVGLIKAVERFDPRLGVPFTAYARQIISGEISHYLRDLAPVLRPPRWLKKLSVRMAQARDALVSRLDRAPTDAELAAEMNIKVEGVREVEKLQNQYNVMSLTAHPDHPDWQPKLDAIRSQHHETFKLPLEDHIVLDNAIEKLAEFEKRVIHLFFYMDLTQTEIAQRLGSTQRQISRTLAKTIKKLKQDVR